MKDEEFVHFYTKNFPLEIKQLLNEKIPWKILAKKFGFTDAERHTTGSDAEEDKKRFCMNHVIDNPQTPSLFFHNI